MENIKVAIRFRPNNNDTNSNTNSNTNCVTINSPLNNLIISSGSAEHHFSFDHIFPSNSSQEDVYNTVAKNAVTMVCNGYNATIFAYGNTGSGKSFTMFGKPGNEGIIPRACKDLFQLINNNENVAEAVLKCSFIEIYQEHFKDLLRPDDPYMTPPVLRLRHSPVKGVYIQNIIEKFVYTYKDILEIIEAGALQRTTAATALNNTSSRSHSVLTLNLTQNMVDGTEISSKLHMIDLAGSENVGKSEVQGTNLDEAKAINKSLSSLANVINALTEKKREHIPYRDSKLTYILQDSLGGNSKTIVIATANPAVTFYSETLNTLKFAKRVKEIKNIPKVNKTESNAHLQKIIDGLNRRIEELEKAQEDSKAIIQAVEFSSSSPSSPGENKEIILLKAINKRLENKIAQLMDNLKKENDKAQQFKDIFEKQRELAVSIAKKLHSQTLKTCMLNTEVEQYRLLFAALKGVSPEVIADILEKFHIEPSSLNNAYAQTSTGYNNIPIFLDDIDLITPDDGGK